MRLYRSYLLRLYRDTGGGEERWRIVLEDPVSAERHRFLCLRDLVAFLEGEMGANAPASPDSTEEGI